MLCGTRRWTFDRGSTSTDLKYSAADKVIERTISDAHQGAYLSGHLPTSGKTAFCLSAGSKVFHTFLGVAVEGINTTSKSEAKQCLVELVSGSMACGAVDEKYKKSLGGVSPGDIIRVLYDADANTLAYFRNGKPYSDPMPLNANALNEKAKLRFFVSLCNAGESAALID